MKYFETDRVNPHPCGECESFMRKYNKQFKTFRHSCGNPDAELPDIDKFQPCELFGSCGLWNKKID